MGNEFVYFETPEWKSKTKVKLTWLTKEIETFSAWEEKLICLDWMILYILIFENNSKRNKIREINVIENKKKHNP